jgi:EmrB/QacA subfamily drug resistance transporter
MSTFKSLSKQAPVPGDGKPHHPKALSRRQRGTLAVVCVGTAMLMLDVAVVYTALPSIARDLHSGLAGVQWVVDAYAVVLAAVVLSAGSLSDRLGRRRLFAAGMAVFTASSLACALAGSILFLDAARAVQGLGAALMFASSLAILADAFPQPRQRAQAMAAYGATVGASFAFGPTIGGAVTTWLDWRAVFVINIPLGLGALAGIAAWVRESRSPAWRPLDWPGQVTLSAGLFLLVLALLRGNADGWGSVSTVTELAVAAGALGGFVLIERRVAAPMLPLPMFARRDFTAAQVTAFAISVGFFGLYLYLTLYLQDVLHLSPLRAGLALMPGTFLNFAVAGASAQFAPRFAAGPLLSAGLVLAAGGVALMTITGTHSSWTVLLPGFLLASAGTGIVNPSLATLALSAGAAKDSGLLAGVNDVFRTGGVAVGVAAYGAIIPAGAAVGLGPATAFVTGLHHCLLAGCVVAAAGAAATTGLIGRGRSRAAIAGVTSADGSASEPGGGQRIRSGS